MIKEGGHEKVQGREIESWAPGVLKNGCAVGCSNLTIQ